MAKRLLQLSFSLALFEGGLKIGKLKGNFSCFYFVKIQTARENEPKTKLVFHSIVG